MRAFSAARAAAAFTIGSTYMKELHARQDRLEFNKLQKRLRRLVGTAIVDYNMIEDGDKVMGLPVGR
jgi:hypothetical protein